MTDSIPSEGPPSEPVGAVAAIERDTVTYLHALVRGDMDDGDPQQRLRAALALLSKIDAMHKKQTDTNAPNAGDCFLNANDIADLRTQVQRKLARLAQQKTPRRVSKKT